MLLKERTQIKQTYVCFVKRFFPILFPLCSGHRGAQRQLSQRVPVETLPEHLNAPDRFLRNRHPNVRPVLRQDIRAMPRAQHPAGVHPSRFRSNHQPDATSIERRRNRYDKTPGGTAGVLYTKKQVVGNRVRKSGDLSGNFFGTAPGRQETSSLARKATVPILASVQRLFDGGVRIPLPQIECWRRRRRAGRLPALRVMLIPPELLTL